MICGYTHDEYMDLVRGFHNYPAPGAIIGGYMVEAARSLLPEGTLFDAISETDHCLPDAIQLLTPCTTGNGWMRVQNFGIYALTLYDKFTGKGVRARLDPDKMVDYPEIKCWFFKEKPKKEQDSEKLQEEIQQAGTAIISTSEVQVSPELLGKKGSGEIARCSLCGEAYPRMHGGICRSCQGESPYASGHGIRLSGRPDLDAVAVEAAVGKTALHDMTRIDPGKSKGPEFKRGQEISAGDVCRLQQMGRSRIYVEGEDGPGEDWLHEDKAAKAFARHMSGPGVKMACEPREGKATLAAEWDGLLTVDAERLERFNLVPEVMCASRHGNTVVKKGTPLAGTRAIPLYLGRDNFLKAMTTLDEGPLFSVLPIRPARIGVLVTGTEVFQGLIEDKFEPIIRRKAEKLGSTVVGTEIVPDDRKAIAFGVEKLVSLGADLIITTAGLSVDPDDVTRLGLNDVGLKDAHYGMPVLPGAMTLVGRIRGAQVLGVPACALFFKTTSLDLILPRLLAGQRLTRADLAKYGHGGMCMECRSCSFPKCPFGR